MPLASAFRAGAISGGVNWFVIWSLYVFVLSGGDFAPLAALILLGVIGFAGPLISVSFFAFKKNDREPAQD